MVVAPEVLLPSGPDATRSPTGEVTPGQDKAGCGHDEASAPPPRTDVDEAVESPEAKGVALGTQPGVEPEEPQAVPQVEPHAPPRAPTSERDSLDADEALRRAEAGTHVPPPDVNEESPPTAVGAPSPATGCHPAAPAGRATCTGSLRRTATRRCAQS